MCGSCAIGRVKIYHEGPDWLRRSRKTAQEGANERKLVVLKLEKRTTNLETKKAYHFKEGGLILLNLQSVLGPPSPS